MIREDNTRADRRRIFFLFFLFIAMFAMVIYRLVSIQYIDADKYKLYAEFQHEDSFDLKSKRGKIFDKNGIEFASSLIEKTITANPQLVKDVSGEAEALSDILGLSKEELEKKLSDKNSGFVYIARKISAEDASKISNLALPGIFIEDECKRYYPLESIASQLIGFTGLDNKGLYGLELQYEEILKGNDGKYTAKKDVFGKVIESDEENYIPPVDGSDIVLTIDSQLQYFMELKLKETAEYYKSTKAIAIVMDPNSGEILSIAQYPTFDLNNYEEMDPENFINSGISFNYEPGSTFKIFNIASALENKTVTSEQIFHLSPSIKVGDRVISEIYRTYGIDYSLKDIIKYSSNVGAVTVALSMGKQLYYESILKFGFGDYSGVNIVGEEKGIIADYKTWPSSAIGALAIGQSISVTPLQLARALSVIANGGYLVTPTVIKEIKGSLPDTQSGANIKEKKQIISAETAQVLKDMMLSVVEEGTGKQAMIDGVQVCGKTGTAQKANKNGAGYSEGRVTTSFIGFAPYENPKVACVVIIDEPQGPEDVIWGGTVAAPVFSKIVEFALKRISY